MSRAPFQSSKECMNIHDDVSMVGTSLTHFTGGGIDSRVCARRIRGAMANMLIQADELRARLLEQLAVMLTPRQLALVLMAPLTMLATPL